MNNDTMDQYLTFRLGDELFALAITSVREIIDDKGFTKIPRTPDYMRGVINLRGHPVPIVDLRLKFGMSRTELGVDTCAIITDIMLDGIPVQIGALADSVQEVIEITSADISPPPKMVEDGSSDFLVGMARYEERFLMILDMEAFLADVEIPSPDLLDKMKAGLDAPEQTVSL